MRIALASAVLALGLTASCKKESTPGGGAPPSATSSTGTVPGAGALSTTDERPCPEVQCEVACRMEGRCSVNGDLCLGSSDADCKRGQACKFLGKCASVSGGDCGWRAANKEACSAGANPCREWGYCTVKEGMCVAGSDADCAGSRHCANYGRCTARGGKCVVSASEERPCKAARGPSAMEPCREHGHCTAKDGVCVAATDEDCKQSEACKDRGRCKANAAGDCVAESDASCKGSDRCDGRGECAAVDGWCVGRTEGKCVLAPPCKDGIGEGWCYSGHDDDDCKDGGHCNDFGRCSFEDGWCVAASDADCKRSERCKKDGYCKAKEGWCVK